VSSPLAFEADGELMARMPVGEVVYVRALAKALTMVC